MINSRKKILVTRFSGMGDVAITAPVLASLVNCPVQILVLTNKCFFPIFEGLQNTELFAIDKVRDMKEVKSLAEILKPQVDLMADLHNVFRSQLLSRNLAKPTKVIQMGSGKTMTAKYSEVFEKFGFPVDPENLQFLKKPKITKEVKTFINSEKLIGFAPSALQAFKSMPKEKAKLLLAALEKMGVQVLLFGNENEAILKELSGYSNVTNIAGKFQFKDELALIARLSLMLSMDSANGHLAANYGVPVLTFWEGTNPTNGYRPFKQPEKNSIFPEMGIEQIIEKVWNFL